MVVTQSSANSRPTAAAPVNGVTAQVLDDLAAQAETEAIADRPELTHLAREYDTRKRRPLAPGPWDDSPDPWPGGSPVAPTSRPHNETLTPGAPETWHGAGPRDRPPLGLTREVISESGPQVEPAAQPKGSPDPVDPDERQSSLGRYTVAAARVDAAFALLEGRLSDAVWSATGGTASDHLRRFSLERKLEATRRRRQAVQHCTRGDLAGTFYRCTCCGQVKLAAIQTCQHRACPRCCSKLRLANQAKLHELLGAVEAHRRQLCRPLPVWRFLTLTIPSHERFRAARGDLCNTWAQLLAGAWWRQRSGVKAAIACLETTHTAAGWHVHLHAVVDSFLPRHELIGAWQLAAWRAHLVPIRRECRGLQRTLTAFRQDPRVNRRPSDQECQRLAFLRGLLRVARTVQEHAIGLQQANNWSEFATWARVVIGNRCASFTSRRHRVLIRRAARCLVAALPTGAGQHVSKPEGSRDVIVRELAKYLAKDLGVGDGAASDWGVFGSAERGCEFLEGTWRWRTLRTYGEAFDLIEPDEACRLECDDCGSADLEREPTRWLTPAQVDDFEAQKRARNRARRQQREQQDTTQTRQRVGVHVVTVADRKVAEPARVISPAERLFAVMRPQWEAARAAAKPAPQQSKLESLLAWAGWVA